MVLCIFFNGLFCVWECVCVCVVSWFSHAVAQNCCVVHRHRRLWFVTEYCFNCCRYIYMRLIRLCVPIEVIFFGGLLKRTPRFRCAPHPYLFCCWCVLFVDLTFVVVVESTVTMTMQWNMFCAREKLTFLFCFVCVCFFFPHLDLCKLFVIMTSWRTFWQSY